MRKLIIWAWIATSYVYSLPVVDPGLFVISGVATCGSGGGYCLLGLDCAINEDFAPDSSGHCEGLKNAFTPRAYFVCCLYSSQNKLRHRPTFSAPIIWKSSTTTTMNTDESSSATENTVESYTLTVDEDSLNPHFPDSVTSQPNPVVNNDINNADIFITDEKDSAVVNKPDYSVEDQNENVKHNEVDTTSGNGEESVSNLTPVRTEVNVVRDDVTEIVPADKTEHLLMKNQNEAFDLKSIDAVDTEQNSVINEVSEREKQSTGDVKNVGSPSAVGTEGNFEYVTEVDGDFQTTQTTEIKNEIIKPGQGDLETEPVIPEISTVSTDGSTVQEELRDIDNGIIGSENEFHTTEASYDRTTDRRSSENIDVKYMDTTTIVSEDAERGEVTENGLLRLEAGVQEDSVEKLDGNYEDNEVVNIHSENPFAAAGFPIHEDSKQSVDPKTKAQISQSFNVGPVNNASFANDSSIPSVRKQQYINEAINSKTSRMPVQKFLATNDFISFYDKIHLDNQKPEENKIHHKQEELKHSVIRDIQTRHPYESSKNVLADDECVNLNSLVSEKQKTTQDAVCVNMWKFSTKGEVLCVGVLLNPTWIVTSASCVTKIFEKGIDNVEASFITEGESSFGISNMIVHENYQPIELHSQIELNNIGLVSLTGAADDTCSPCIPKSSQSFTDQQCISYNNVTSSRFFIEDDGCEGRVKSANMFSKTFLTLPCKTQQAKSNIVTGSSLWCGDALAGIETTSSRDVLTFTPVSEFVSWIVQNVKLYSR